MEIRDVLHGSIYLDPIEIPIIDHPYFQRLRSIQQLGFGHLAFPAATHNRYIHSLGAMEVFSRIFRSLFYSDKFRPSALTIESDLDRRRLYFAGRWAALLHDIGHGPLSHTTECAMPDVEKLGKLPHQPKNRRASHEDYSLKILSDSDLTDTIEKAGARLGVTSLDLCLLLEPDLPDHKGFFKVRTNEGVISLRPLLSQFISGELDADRMDYLRRDSLMSGVSYGQFDADWLISNLSTFVHDGAAFAALDQRALYSFEDFLLSRYHMFLMVYFHQKNVVYDEMLRLYLTSPRCEYLLPADIEQYIWCTDSQLFQAIQLSDNLWAKRIAQGSPFRVVGEFHDFENQVQENRTFQDLKKYLQTEDIEFLHCESKSVLSKYDVSSRMRLFVKTSNAITKPKFLPIEKCSDLFERYKATRSLNRIYISPENLDKVRKEFGSSYVVA